MNQTVTVDSPAGPLLLRPERVEDQAFRYDLFRQSRLPEWDLIVLPPDLRAQLMQHQFQAQTVGYLAQFPLARFDIIELGGTPIGRIVVDRPGDHIHIVDQAILPGHRNQGIGSAIMRALMREAAEAGQPVRLKVASSNDPSMRLYARLGFVPIGQTETYLEMEWQVRDGVAAV